MKRREKLRWLAENEQGAVAVLMALCMTMLLGFTSIAVDYGALAAERHSLQNAADAAALASALKMKDSRDGTVLRTEAQAYAAKNGVADPDSVTAIRNGSRVTVEIGEETPMGFSSILTGRSSMPVRVTATAELQSPFGNYPYALFAGQTIEESGTGINITGNNIYIKSPIHSNSNISMPNATLVNGAVATAVGSTGHSGMAGWERAPELPMPDYRSFRGDFKNVCYAAGNIVIGNAPFYTLDNFVTYMKGHIMAYEGIPAAQLRNEGLTIYIPGSLTFHGHGSYDNAFDNLPVNLVVHGDIELNGCELKAPASAPLVLISEQGNITVNGGGEHYHGLIYAPHGDVTLNGNGAVITGSVVAQNIRKNGGKITVEYYEGADDYIPAVKVRLVE